MCASCWEHRYTVKTSWDTKKEKKSSENSPHLLPASVTFITNLYILLKMLWMKTLCIWVLYINILWVRWCAYACEAPFEQELQAFCPDNLCLYQPTFCNMTACLPMSLQCFSDVIFTGFRLKQSISGNMPGLQIKPQHGYTLPNFIASTMEKREFPVSQNRLWTVSHLWVP